MVNVLVRHKVSDYERWKHVFDGHLAMRKAGGELAFRMFYNHLDGSDVFLFFDWETLDKAKAFFNSATLQNAMKEAGVTGHVEVVFLDEVRAIRRTSAD